MQGGIPILKMSGAGNDFVVLDRDTADRLGDGLVPWIRAVCRRGLSVGADGVLVVEPIGPDRAAVRYFNADGSAAFCGNGTRCAARFARLRGYTGSRATLETAIGDVPAEVVGATVRITLPAPRDAGAAVLDLGEIRLAGRRIDAGVPHFVVRVDDVDGFPLERWGPRVRGHDTFGRAGANFDVVQFDAAGRAHVRTWERGVEGETLACGTGAVATALASRLERPEDVVTIVPRSGRPLLVRFAGEGVPDGSVVLEGDARVVLEGVVSSEGA